MLLQIFIYLNIFLAGAAIALASWFAYNHLSGKKQGENPKSDRLDAPTLSKASRDRLLHSAETKFQMIIAHATGELQYDLKDTSDNLSGRLKSLGDEIVDTEMQRYKASLDELRQQTETSIGDAAAEVAKHQTELQAAMKQRLSELEAALVQDIAAEKQHLTDQLDKKLAGSVTAFLIETLGHNVDLGAQSAYLTETLEKHKAELIKEIGDEA
jgi:F0F1-type ATP synthase membrane subunit b/b'